MLRNWPKFWLAATAFAPILFTHAAVCALHNEWQRGGFLVVLGLSSWLICMNVIGNAKLHLAQNPVSIKSVKPADKESVAFMIAYIVPLARGSSFDFWPMSIALLVFFVVVMNSNAYLTNPLLGIARYHFYDIGVGDMAYVLISRKQIRNPRSVKRAVNLTDYMMLDIDA